MKTVFTAHLEAAPECIPTKPRAICQAPLKAKIVREKRDYMKKASPQLKNPKKTRGELTKTYKIELE